MPRQLFVTIDGDGFIYRTNYDGRRVGEVIYSEILTRYPIPFCASVVAGDHEAYPGEFDFALARRIFALPNVEAASHSWSHPDDWTSNTVDLRLEIVDSARYINTQLLPDGKQVKILLWSGQCNPTAKALEVARRHNLANLNGGRPDVPFQRLGSGVQYCSRAPNDWQFMRVRPRMDEAGAVLVYPFLREYAGRLDGFNQSIDFFKAHPEFPVHVYFHWYSAVRRDSLAALKRVLDWCMQQPLQPAFPSEYIETVRPVGV